MRTTGVSVIRISGSTQLKAQKKLSWPLRSDFFGHHQSCYSASFGSREFGHQSSSGQVQTPKDMSPNLVCIKKGLIFVFTLYIFLFSIAVIFLLLETFRALLQWAFDREAWHSLLLTTDTNSQISTFYFSYIFSFFMCNVTYRIHFLVVSAVKTNLWLCRACKFSETDHNLYIITLYIYM